MPNVEVRHKASTATKANTFYIVSKTFKLSVDNSGAPLVHSHIFSMDALFRAEIILSIVRVDTVNCFAVWR